MYCHFQLSMTTFNFFLRFVLDILGPEKGCTRLGVLAMEDHLEYCSQGKDDYARV